MLGFDIENTARTHADDLTIKSDLAMSFSKYLALLNTSVIALVRLTPEGVGEHLERGFGQQLAGFA